MSEQDQLHQAVADIYEAAVQPAAWITAVDNIRKILDSAGGVIFFTDPEQQIMSWHSVALEPNGVEYGEHIYAIDPRVKWVRNAPPGSLCWDYRYANDREMDRHEFYDWMARKSGVRYFIGAHYQLADGSSLFASINRAIKQDHVDETDIGHFELLAPHIRNAMALSQQLALTKERASLFDLLNQSAGEGLILLSKTGRVIGTNAEADRILAENDGLAVVEGHLKANKAADTRRLSALVMDAVAVTSDGSAVTSLARPSGKLSYLLRVLPWPLHLEGATETAAAVAMIKDPEHRSQHPDHADLRTGLGLSRREAELAVLLGEGKSVPEAAAAMKISVNTARVHLAHIFEKTGASNQGDLLRLLMSIP